MKKWVNLSSDDSIKKFVIFSFLFHLFLFSLLFHSWNTGQKKIFYTPVYTVSLTSPGMLGLKKKDKMAKKAIKHVKRRKAGVEKKVEKNIIAVKKEEKIESLRPIQGVAAKGKGVAEGGFVHLEEKIRRMRRERALEELKKRIRQRRTSEGKHIFMIRHTGKVSEGTLDLAFKQYYNIIWRRIKQVWVLPSDLFPDKGLETILALRIAKDGKIEKVWMEKSSKNPFLDESALRAIKKIDPLPPLPEGMGKNYLEVGIRFRPSEA